MSQSTPGNQIPEHDPTPEEIAAECAKIREEWSEAETWRRAGYLSGRRPHWTVPRGRVSADAG